MIKVNQIVTKYHKDRKKHLRYPKKEYLSR